ncbi:quinon protein alcohol dehydrogenase-like superfamily [Rhizoctonia solani]|nr:quinon protein alcohol dehydrogenase-like superfamily [Rhizoctonia solani]
MSLGAVQGKLNASLFTWEIVDKQATEARLNSIQPAKSAFYDSRAASSINRRKCTPHTREQAILDILSWKDNNGRSNLYWLNGMAGTGKTTIANTVCAILDESHQLGASFFCTRSHIECRDVNVIFPTIAYQLARFSHPFCLALVQALEQSADLQHRALEKQFECMIAAPAVKSLSSCVVVIDALDECEDSQGVEHILKVISSEAIGLPIKFLVSGRPEPQLQRHMARTASQLVLHDLDHGVVKEDIKTYLRTELKSDFLVLNEPALEALVERAGVLFIYAATVVRYIGADYFTLDPNRRLATVLSATATPTSALTRSIDTLYRTIIDFVFNNPNLEPSDKELLKLVLHTIVCAQEPLSINALNVILKLGDAARVKTALQHYVLDPSRSKEYACQEESQHNKLATLCFNRIKRNKRQFNICQLESSYVFDEQVSGIDERINQAIPLDLLYACQHWAVHLQLGENSSEQERRLSEFLSAGLLLWMEILNLKKRISLGSGLLERAKKWCQEAKCSIKTQDLVYDAWRFVTMFSANPVSHCTPHIYTSMLPFWPEPQPISRCYKKFIKGLVDVKGVAMARRRLALLGRTSLGRAVKHAAFSQDGSHAIFCGDDDNTLYIWNTECNTSAGVLRGHTAPITSLVFSSDGRYIASGSRDLTVRVWDIVKLEAKIVLDTSKEYTHPVTVVALCPDGTRVASGRTEICIWDTQTGQRVAFHSGYQGPRTSVPESVNNIVFSPNGIYIASTWSDGPVRLWHTRSGEHQGGPPKEHTGSVASMVFSPNGKQIVCGCNDGTIRVCDVRTGQLVLGPLEGRYPSQAITTVAFSRDGKSIISGSSDNTICIWDVNDGKQLAGAPLVGHKKSVRSVAISHDGARAFSISYDATLCEFQLHGFESPRRSVQTVAFSPDCALIASGYRDGTVRVWDAQSGRMEGNPLRELEHSMRSIIFSPDGTCLMSGSGGLKCNVRFWDLKSREELQPPIPFSHSIMSIGLSSDGTRLVCGDFSGDGYLCEVGIHPDHPSRYARTASFAVQTWSLRSIAISPDGNWVAVSENNHILLWDVQAKSFIQGGKFSGHDNSVTCIAFSPSGRHIVSGSSDNTIRIWGAQNRETTVGPIKGHTDNINSVMFSPDGALIASASRDNTIRIWDAQNGHLVFNPLRGHTSSVESAVFSSDGTRIASGSDDTTVRVWDLQSLKQSLLKVDTHSASHHTRLAHSKPSLSESAASKLAWVLDEDGWLRDELQNYPLVWIPPDLRELLIWPHNTLLISSRGSFKLDFTNARLGEAWSKCYQV